MRVAIVGGGIAGAMLASRLLRHTEPAAVELFLGGRPAGADATGASGGLVRGYETDRDACRLAVESLAELLGSSTLRQWSDYREIGSVYLTGSAADPTGQLDIVNDLVPGSASAACDDELAARCPLLGLPLGTVGIIERRAGYLSPARLRAAVLAEVASANRATVHDIEVDAVARGPLVRLGDGTERGYDVVVVAAGAWSLRLLAAAGTDCGALRTKRIQYSVYPGAPAGLGAFVDETSGLYGRPTDDGGLLIGLPSDEWDVDPDAVAPDGLLAARVAARARARLGAMIGNGTALRTVASFDGYAESPGLVLRPAEPVTGLYSFTGGSGGAAKTVLAASRRAVDDLLRRATVT
jgi:glycine/D-amino acid oxidase-like deaminating enzyme